MYKRLLAGVLLSMPLVCAVAPAAAGAPPARDDYAIVASIPGPDGMWDYAAISADERRLYLAQGEHISMLDLGGVNAWTQMGVPEATWHGAVPLESRGLVLGSNGRAHALTLFDARSHALIAAVPTSGGPTSKLSGKMAAFAVLADPDAVVVEPKSGLVAAVNGGSGEIAFVDLDRRAVVGRVQVGGKLEFAVADGNGLVYVNSQTAHDIAVIDARNFKVARRIPLAGCTEPKGLAYDAGTDLLISGCDNGVAKFVVARSGKVVSSRKIGPGADAVMLDPIRHRVFVPSGDAAIMSIFDIEDPAHITLIQELKTEAGVRLGAVDTRTGKVYLPAGTLAPPVPPRPWPSVAPGSFHMLVVGPAARSE